MTSRRYFLGALLGSSGVLASDRFLGSVLAATTGASVLNRSSLVRRHNPVVTRIDTLSPLSVGNGSFAFTVDVTGLQTIPTEYQNAMPLCTMSQWGWHSTPRPTHLEGASLKLTSYDTHGRQVGYPTSSEGQTELFNWLRENPHRLHLGRISLVNLGSDVTDIRPTDITDIRQSLDLWSGVITSYFKLNGEPVKISTVAHPTFDQVAVVVDSRLIETKSLGVLVTFPFASPGMQAADWTQPAKHKTDVLRHSPNRLELHRTLDSDNYYVAISTEGQSSLSSSAHSVVLKSESDHRLSFSVYFAHESVREQSPTVSATLSASADYWQRFWSQGGAVELADSKDSRANELERRIVLSQYLTAIQCSGTVPPQETGLTVNSWYGKFHLEMHWWHAAHFALWNRLPLFERSLGWYQAILPKAVAHAQSQGYAGARWPKMVGPGGRDSPSPIGPLLIWQQPHPIFYAELCYQSHPNRQTLQRYRDLVFESASFMSSYAYFDRSNERYVLGPPVIPAQENHPPRETWNPTFELAYWSFGLNIAQRWRERLGLQRLRDWDEVINKLSKLPTRDGVYLAHENCPQTYTERNHDHPSMFGALGVLPGDVADRETMRRTLHKTLKEWKWDDTWGWDYPLTALTAARLGEPQIAIDALLMKTEKNRYLTNGHNYQRPNLPCYLPGNGGLLYAIAMMAAGWKGAPQKNAPGFPDDGSWSVKWEGLNSSVSSKF